MVYHRSDSGGSSSADTAARRHSESSRGTARDEEHSKSRDDGDDSKYSSDYSRGGSRYKDGRYSESSRSRNGKDDGKYGDSSRYSKDSRSRDGREEGKYYDRSRDGREEGSRYREGKDDGRYAEGSSRYSRYSDSSRYSSRYRDEPGSRRYGGGSSRYHGEDESGSGYDPDDDAPYRRGDAADDTTAETSEQEKLKNVFENDGSFLEMFKKMQEASNPTSSETAEPSTSESNVSEANSSDKQEATSRQASAIAPKRGIATGIVGKRRGGRVLPTGLVKKQKKEEEEEETPKDAWSLYMAEVYNYFAMPELAVMASKKDSTPELSTAPFDPRFPNMNQTRYCWQSYVDYYRCQKVKGEDYAPCDYFKKCFKALCPNAWIEKWDTQREENRFPARI